MIKAQFIIENGMMAKGKNELLKHLDGEKLTYKEAILAKCYDCEGYFIDGKEDCMIYDCPLYGFMAYNPKRKPSKIMSEEHKAKLAASRSQKIPHV